MKRCCILSVYNEKGIVHPYLIYYINSLAYVVDELIIIANGKLEKQSYQKLREFTSKVYVRENIGYDIGAYQEVFDKYFSMEKLQEYEELVLSNDTCFGPFISFEEIFKKMQLSVCDFWGITYSNTNNLWPHLQSYFLVFRKNAITETVEYIKNRIGKNLRNKIDVIYQFELGLFHHLDKQGFQYGYYSSETTLGVHKWPYQQIKYGNCPIMKIGAFENYDTARDNLLAAFQYIKHNYAYDVNLITEMIYDKYQFIRGIESDEYDCDESEKVKKYIISKTSPMEIRNFFKIHNHIYIYGTGDYADMIFWYYHNDLHNLEGFIVSERKEKENQWMNYPVFTLSEISYDEIAIMVAMTKEHTDEVREKLKNYKCVFYLWN